MRRLTAIALLLLASLVLAACQPAAPAAAPATEAPTAAPTEAATEVMTDTAAAAPAAPTADIVDTAIAAGNFKTLVAAVQAAGLVDTLKGEGPFTVFAPTDEAFAALPAGTVESLLKDPKGQLTQILLYHVVPGKVLAADVKDGLEADTAQGGKVKFSVADGKVKINDANIVATDILATNGVIHVIDAVILPPEK
jgi:transforming growth factor-beta-induced protein